jgi:uncharacterized delta-60 repeat protein
MKLLSKTTVAAAALLLGLLSGCGGGGEATPSGPTLIGATGGTVAGPLGAQVVVPAGALAQGTAIAVAQTSTGAPALPAGITAFGQTFAFTPHGTSFTTPVTISVPFDPANVPAGTTPALYKTNAAQSAFELVAGATVSGGVMSGQVTGFSYAVVATPPKNSVTEVDSVWLFGEGHADGNWVTLDPVGSSSDRELYDFRNLGPLTVFPPGWLGSANAEVYASAAGDVYWVSTQAPMGDISKPSSLIGSEVQLLQEQTFKKTSDAASMDLVVSQSTLEMMDLNPHLPTQLECPHLLSAPMGRLTVGSVQLFLPDCGNLMDVSLSYNIEAWKQVPIKDANGVITGYGAVTLTHGTVFAHLYGYLKDLNTRIFFSNWRFDFGPSGDGDLHFKVAPDFEYLDNVDNDPDATHALARLNRSTIIQIPLDAVDKDGVFKVTVTVAAHVNNRRQLESFVGARFRDPQKLSGISYQSQGVVPIAAAPTGLPTPPPAAVEPAPSCATGTDPAAGTLQFQQAAVYTPEATSQGQYMVWVTRTGGSKGELTVRLSTQDGTAHAGSDYTAVSTLLRFADGEQGQRFVAVPITNNLLIDGARSVNLTLSDLRGCAALGTPASTVLTIMDDDAPLTPSNFTLGGSVNGLAGSGLTLRTTSGEQVQPVGNGTFVFASPMPDGLSYGVSVATQPSNPIQICTVTNGSGTITGANVSNIVVDCATPLPNGSLDATFGNGGKVATGIAFAPAVSGAPVAMALQADGRVLLLGGLKLLRYNSDGSADTAFGTAGAVTVPFSGSVFDAATATDVAVQVDGKLVVVGFTHVNNQDDFALARFNANGTLDTSFGSAGKLSTDFFGNTDQARRVRIQPDGKIVVAGLATTGSGVTANTDFAVARYNPDGSLDTTFGSGGKVNTNIAGKYDSALGMALQGDGKIVLAGRVGVDGGLDPDFGVARYDASGNLDASFGAGGIVRTDFGLGNWEEAADVAVQGDGRILVTGRVRIGAAFTFALARLNGDGTADAGFGTAGLATTAVTSQSDVAKALLIQADGKIVVVGQSTNLSPNPDMAIARYQANGSLDTAFGAAGKLTVDFFGAIDGAEAVAVQPDGKIIVGGFARNAGTTGFALIRLVP